MINEFDFGTRVIFGIGAHALLQSHLYELEVRRPLIVTDEGLTRAGVVDQVISCLDSYGRTVVFDGVRENPSELSVESAAELYTRSGCDGVVGVGGGSSMDTAKALVVLLGDERPLSLRAFHLIGWQAMPLPRVPPLVLLPTTAGTGSETGRGAVLIFKDGRKSGLLCRGVVRLALCDPELTRQLPAHLTAVTGMDAISHCVETFCAPASNPPADAIALDGLERLLSNIEAATRDGHDLEARCEMMMGASEGGMTFQKGLGAIHALSHPLGGSGAHHGAINAVLLPHVLERNAPFLGSKLDILGKVAGGEPRADLPRYFDDLRARLGIPGKLRDLGIDRNRLAVYAEQSLADSSQSNPCPMGAEDYLAVLKSAW